MLCVPCYVLLCQAHILEGLYDLISVESNRLLGIRIDSNRVHSSKFFTSLRIYSRVPLNGLPVSRKSLILELTRIVFALRRFDSVWVYWTWVRHLHQRVEEHKNVLSSIGKHFRAEHSLAPKDLNKNFKILKKCKNKFDCLNVSMYSPTQFVRRFLNN